MKRKFLLVIFVILTLLWTVFIHSNSLESGTESDQKSSFVTEIVNSIASNIGIKQEISHASIRTLAHFSEFAILSLLICSDMLIALFPLFVKKPPCFIIASLISTGISFAVACTDELLQKSADGRAAELSDVLVDTLGALTGAVLFTAIFFIIVQIFKKSLYRNKKL